MSLSERVLREDPANRTFDTVLLSPAFHVETDVYDVSFPKAAQAAHSVSGLERNV
jgi:hypothetical protein